MRWHPNNHHGAKGTRDPDNTDGRGHCLHGPPEGPSRRGTCSGGLGRSRTMSEVSLHSRGTIQAPADSRVQAPALYS